jgi:hypothetical protein
MPAAVLSFREKRACRREFRVPDDGISGCHEKVYHRDLHAIVPL